MKGQQQKHPTIIKQHKCFILYFYFFITCSKHKVYSSHTRAAHFVRVQPFFSMLNQTSPLDNIPRMCHTHLSALIRCCARYRDGRGRSNLPWPFVFAVQVSLLRPDSIINVNRYTS